MNSSSYSIQEVWAAMKAKEYATLHNMVLNHHVLKNEKDIAVFQSIFQLDIAVPFVILLWHITDNNSPEELLTLIADCMSFNPPLSKKRTAVMHLINYFLAADKLSLLSIQQ